MRLVRAGRFAHDGAPPNGPFRAARPEPGPPAPACTTSPAAPRTSDATIDALARSMDLRWNSGTGDATFTRYGAWKYSGPNPDALHASRNSVARSSENAGPRHCRGLDANS